MDKSEKVRSKIIILYILKCLPGITFSELTSIVIDTCYMNYFSFICAFDDLIENSFVTKSRRKNEEEKDSSNLPVFRCDITPKGLEILENLNHVIPEHIHTFLSGLSIDWNKKIKKSSHIKASFDPDLFGSYTATLKLSDGIKDIILIKLTVPDKDTAHRACENWQSGTSDKYMDILKMLTS